MLYKRVKSQKGLFFEGPLLIEPNIFQDQRGFFYESWNKSKFNKIIDEEIEFRQDNHSFSTRGVLRGLHYQLPALPQAKLVRCTKGLIFDVIVDIRQNSKTFGSWAGVQLNDNNKELLWVPNGFAHGFLTMSDFAEVQYKVTNYWKKELDNSIIWNDEDININWPLELINVKKPFLSNKDKTAESLKIKKSKGEIF